MTKGGPGYASTTIVMYIYQQAFKFDRLGLAATMAIVLLLIMVTLAAIQLRLFRREIEF
jgi:multiple sugar transport system permease protein